MRIPEFTAEASLYEASNRYRSPGELGGPQGPYVVPQLGGKNFKGFAGCQMDCLDTHPGWTAAQCARSCRDPFAGRDLGTSGSWFNRFLTDAGISGWELACNANPVSGSVPFLCGALADEMRRQS